MTFLVRPWFWVLAVFGWLWLSLGLSTFSDSSIGYRAIFTLFLK